jgi:hypothetical protein
MPDLPSPARAAIEFGRANFLGADRGHVRGSNDTSIDSRFRDFAGWLHVPLDLTSSLPDA